MLAPATAPCYPPLASHAATPKATKRLSPPIWPSFFALADVWKLSIDGQIVLLGTRAIHLEGGGGALSVDQEDRVSHLLSIFKALQVLFPVPDRADRWLRNPHRFFGGRSALDVILGGKLEDIVKVRNDVDAPRGG